MPTISRAVRRRRPCCPREAGRRSQAVSPRGAGPRRPCPRGARAAGPAERAGGRKQRAPARPGLRPRPPQTRCHLWSPRAERANPRALQHWDRCGAPASPEEAAAVTVRGRDDARMPASPARSQDGFRQGAERASSRERRCLSRGWGSAPFLVSRGGRAARGDVASAGVWWRAPDGSSCARRTGAGARGHAGPEHGEQRR